MIFKRPDGLRTVSIMTPPKTGADQRGSLNGRVVPDFTHLI